MVSDIAGDGSYDIALPAGWVDGYSVVRRIETPTGNQVPSIVEPDRYGIERLAASVELRFYDMTPPNGDTIRLTFTQPHAVTAGASSVPVQDDAAVAAMASALCCRQLAARHTHDFDSTMSADSVDFQGSPGRYLLLATTLEREFEEHLGIGDASSDVAAAMVLHDLDPSLSWGERRVFHGPRVT